MINGIKYLCLMGCLVLVACNPLSEDKDFENKIDQVSDELIQYETEFVVGDVPKNYGLGQWRIINIWAEWCKPCWQEIPELNQFFTTQENIGPKLLGFNFDELETEELVVLKEKMSIEFPILTQWPESWTKPEIKGLPATVILSPDNKVINILWGAQNVASLHKGIEDAKNTIRDRQEED